MNLNLVSHSPSSTHSRTDNAPGYEPGEWGFDSLWVRMQGKLAPEIDYAGHVTGKMVCISCHLWNCWHGKGEPCDITGCECELGHEDQQ